MKPLRWPTEKVASDYMRMRQEQNAAKVNGNEDWMAEKLEKTGRKWTRQALWGYRIFDFWCHELGIAVEVDGDSHRADYDAYRDTYNYRRSGIVVLRVRNRDEKGAEAAVQAIKDAVPWKQRRAMLGLDAKTKKGRRHLVT